MTGPELRTIRLKLGMTPAQFGRAMGYTGKCGINVHALEGGRKTIKLRIERTAKALEMLGKNGIPEEWINP